MAIDESSRRESEEIGRILREKAAADHSRLKVLGLMERAQR